MFKKGFTLQELLITLGIIGIVAAITAPAITGMFPDKTKMKYMKAYNTLTTITNEILDDPSMYYTTYNAAGNPNCSGGLMCGNIPLTQIFQDIWVNEIGWTDRGDEIKYGLCLASKMNIQEEFGRNLYYDDGEYDLPIHAKFTTLDGTLWLVTDPYGLDDPNSKIVINIDPEDDDNDCVYSAECTDPKRFTFEVDYLGGIKPTDALGRAYLKNPTDMHSTSADKEAADGFLQSTTTTN